MFPRSATYAAARGTQRVYCHITRRSAACSSSSSAVSDVTVTVIGPPATVSHRRTAQKCFTRGGHSDVLCVSIIHVQSTTPAGGGVVRLPRGSLSASPVHRPWWRSLQLVAQRRRLWSLMWPTRQCPQHPRRLCLAPAPSRPPHHWWIHETICRSRRPSEYILVLPLSSPSVLYCTVLYCVPRTGLD